MALQGSGAISLLNIATEFPDSPPYSLSEFYRNGGKVPSNNVSVPTSGTISLSNFYNATNQTSLVITSNQNNLNLRTWALSNGWGGSTPLVVTLNSGVWINGSVAGNSTAALTIDGSFPAGVTFINNGTIAGRGGTGGAGATVSSNATAGQAGGRALLVSTAVSIQNNGTIAGGGGGGGGGASASNAFSCNMGDTDCISQASGGGGGGGRSNVNYGASGGSASNSSTLDCTTTRNVVAGGDGNSSGAGSGGASQDTGVCSCPIDCESEGGAGGNGGGWGTSGSTGSSPAFGNTLRGAASGGAAGQAVSGNSNITWLSTGTRLGPIV